MIARAAVALAVASEALALYVVHELIAHGRIRRAHLGIAGQNVELPRALVRRLDLLQDAGVLITGLESDGPAAKACLDEGDVIVSWNGREVSRIDDLHRLLTATQIGVPSTLEVIRDNEIVQVTVTPRQAGV